MIEKVCPRCGCTFTGLGYARKNDLYCCEPCANGEDCECGNCALVTDDEIAASS